MSSGGVFLCLAFLSAVAVNDKIQYALVEVGPPTEQTDSTAAAAEGLKEGKKDTDKEKKVEGGKTVFGKGKRNTGSLLSSLQGKAAEGEGVTGEGTPEGAEGAVNGTSVEGLRRHLIVAADLVGPLAAKWRCSLKTVATFPGASLEGSL